MFCVCLHCFVREGYSIVRIVGLSVLSQLSVSRPGVLPWSLTFKSVCGVVLSVSVSDGGYLVT